jgi:proteasome lid subunit RPN8/RPN11
VEIPVPVLDTIVRHSRAAAPLEACGLLAAGSDGVVTTAYCLDNVDASPTSYTVDPVGHVRALYDAEGRGWRLAAVFHSHPDGPPVPSAADVAGALEPEWVHVIVGLGGGEPRVRGYRIIDGNVAEEPIVVGAA